MKTMLAAALLGTGANGWAQDVYTSVYERNATYGDANIWTASDATEWGLTLDVPTAEGGTGSGLYKNASSGTSNEKTFTITAENPKIKYEATWELPTRTWLGSSGVYLTFGNKFSLTAQSQWNNQATIYANTGGDPSAFASQLNTTTLPGGKYTLEVVFNTSTRKIENLIFNSVNYTSTVEDVVFPEGTTFNTMKLGWIKGSQGYEKKNAITALTVSQMAQTVTGTSYTINYKDGDNIVKQVTGDGVVGGNAYAELAIDGTEEGYVGVHYLATATVAPSMTFVADPGSNVLNVPVRRPYTATLKVTTTINGSSNTATSTLTETDEKDCSWNYAYSLYTKSGDVYYLCDAETFAWSGTFADGDVIEKSVSYSTADENVVYFEEAEGTAGTNASYSNGSDGSTSDYNYYSRGKELGNFPAGTYTVIAKVTGNTGNALNVRSIPTSFNAGTNTDNSASEVLATMTAAVGVQTENFVLTETKKIILNGANNGNKVRESLNFDYVIIRNAETVSATLGTNGYATFASSEPLDLRSTILPEGLTAYKAAVSGTTVTFIALDQTVPANTGVLLQGTASETYNIPVASSGTAVEGNAFLVNDAGTTFTGDADYYYFGLIKNSLTFGVFDPSSVAIPANKAYLKVLKSSIDESPSRALTVKFGDEATGINAIKSEEMKDNSVYNLSGQRVSQPTKGLYIVNGKKVIIK